MKPGAAQVLIVDDEPHICELIRDSLLTMGCRCQTTTEPRLARQLLDTQQFSLMVTDVVMPDVSGLDLLAHVRKNVPGCKVILITGQGNTKILTEALNLGAYEFIPKPLNIQHLTDAVLRAMRSPQDEGMLSVRAAKAILRPALDNLSLSKAIETEYRLAQASLESIGALARAVEAKDPYTHRHSEQVAHYAVNLAEFLEIPSADVKVIRTAALLHDIGKIGIPDKILTKPGKLTDEEFAHVRRHPVLGGEILKNISVFANEALIVRHHHEWWDGNGYPDGLAGEAIPLGARIINIADSIDAMLMRRTYKDAFPIQKMLSEVSRCAGRQFSPDIAAAAVEWCRMNPQKMILPN